MMIIEFVPIEIFSPQSTGAARKRRVAGVEAPAIARVVVLLA
jgi:hypothetical protein